MFPKHKALSIKKKRGGTTRETPPPLAQSRRLSVLVRSLRLSAVGKAFWLFEDPALCFPFQRIT